MGEDDELDAVTRVELGQQVGDVGFRGAGFDVEPLGDLAVLTRRYPLVAFAAAMAAWPARCSGAGLRSVATDREWVDLPML